MKMRLEVALPSLLFMVSIWHVTSQMSHTSETRWTCICSSVHQDTQSSIIAGNCSGSCNCGPAGSTGNKWSCTCAGDQLPHLNTENQSSGCFKACNCTTGALSAGHLQRKHISRKIVVIVLFVCLVFTTLAFVASFSYWFYKKDRNQLLSDKGSSYNSATDLIRYKSHSQPQSRIDDGSTANSIKGCISISSLLYKRKSGKFCGAVIHFPYNDLEQATDKFSDANLIGVGASSHVYRGQLIDGRTLAVKRLKTSGTDSDSEFFQEVELISRLHHCHIVPLYGYCSLSSGKQSERLLVFEYMGNGNLRDSLDGVLGNSLGKYLDWRTRISIALGTAKGLEYLHEAAAPRILHRDVKSTNILLDENWRAKITDLGMAKRLNTDGLTSCSSSPERIQGTFGYFAPEYAIVGKGSLKSDVFSFGVVLLELITGRAPIFNVSDMEESLVMWAAPRLLNSKRVISELPDPHLRGKFPEEEMQIMAYLAKECLLLDPESRPSMSEVVQVLSTIAPDKSSQRRYSTNFFQSLSIQNARNEQPAGERCTNQVEVLVDSEELKQMSPSRWSSRSLSFDIDRYLLPDSITHPISLSSVQYIDTLLSLKSNGRYNATIDDDETVDLTEPRLEAFSIENGR